MEEAIELLNEHRIAPCRLRDRCEDSKRFTFLPTLVVVNQYDDAESDEIFELLQALLEEDWPLLPVSAVTGRNLDQLKQVVFDQLDIIRVYTRPPGEEPDFSTPFVLKKGSTVEEFAGKVHKDFYEQLKSARIWGSGVFEGQMVSRDYILQDGDVVELRI